MVAQQFTYVNSTKHIDNTTAPISDYTLLKTNIKRIQTADNLLHYIFNVAQ